jgi:hypothetical protein
MELTEAGAHLYRKPTLRLPSLLDVMLLLLRTMRSSSRPSNAWTSRAGGKPTLRKEIGRPRVADS